MLGVQDELYCTLGPRYGQVEKEGRQLRSLRNDGCRVQRVKSTQVEPRELYLHQRMRAAWVSLIASSLF
jgi:hypothetical protein